MVLASHRLLMYAAAQTHSNDPEQYQADGSDFLQVHNLTEEAAADYRGQSRPKAAPDRICYRERNALHHQGEDGERRYIPSVDPDLPHPTSSGGQLYTRRRSYLQDDRGLHIIQKKHVSPPSQRRYRIF